MARSQEKPRRKASGGRYHSFRTKKRHELAGYPAQTKLETEEKRKIRRTRGSNQKNVVLTTNSISVTDAKGKATKTTILNVVGNPANPHLVRRNIITKGSVVETKLGKARVTSRPGQHGVVNGVLVTA